MGARRFFRLMMLVIRMLGRLLLHLIRTVKDVTFNVIELVQSLVVRVFQALLATILQLNKVLDQLEPLLQRLKQVLIVLITVLSLAYFAARYAQHLGT